MLTLVQAASPAISLPSPGGSLLSPSPRRISRRDADLGLPTATSPADSPPAASGPAPAPAPPHPSSPASAASQPYYASPDDGADRTMSEDDGDDDDEEISLAGTPEVGGLYTCVTVLSR